MLVVAAYVAFGLTCAWWKRFGAMWLRDFLLVMLGASVAELRYEEASIWLIVRVTFTALFAIELIKYTAKKEEQ